ncbi:MAG TPA: hypothetical protein VGF67_08025 [Ktedonobacteraceae bacterium]
MLVCQPLLQDALVVRAVVVELVGCWACALVTGCPAPASHC